jgi:hypothetical protein
VEKNDLPSAVYAFRLYTGSGSVIVDTINLSLVNAVDGTDVSNAALRYDNGVLGVFDDGVTDPVVASLSPPSGDYYRNTNLTETVDSNGTNFIVTLDISSSATAPSVKLILEDSEDGANPGIKEETGQTDVDVQLFTNTDFEGNLRYLVTADVVTLDTTSQPAGGNVTVGNNEVAVYAFNLSTPGAATMENVNFLLTGAAEYGTHISGVSLYRDEGTIANSYDGLDVLVTNFSYITGYLKNTSTLSEPIDSGGVDYIVTVDVIGGDGQVITMALEAAPGANEGIGLEWPDTISFAQTPGNNFTIVPGAGPSDPPVLANPLSGTSAQRTWMGLVDVFYSGLDPNFGAVDYVVASCQYSLTNGGSWTQATNGGPGWEYFTDSAQDFSFIWNAAADVTDENNSAYVKIEVKDADDNYSGSWTTQTAIAIDTKEPGIPGDLQNDGLTPVSIDISWPASSGDAGGNWGRYEVYHRPCSGCALDNNQSNGEIQNTFDNLASPSMTITDLTPNTDYTMNVWAVDTFGNATMGNNALTFTTVEAVDTVIVSNYNASLIENNNVEKGQRYAMFGFTLKSSPGTASLNNATIHLDPASTGDQTDIDSVTLYEDNGTMLGRYDGSDTSVGNMAWDGTDAYTLNNAPANYEIGTSETEFVMAVTPAIGATDDNMLQFTFSNATTDVTAVSPDTVAAISPTFNGPQYTINPDTLTVTRHFLSQGSGNVQRGQTYAMFGVNLNSSPGESTLNNMSIHFTGDQNDIGSVVLLLDNGTSNGAYDGSDATLANMSWDNTDAYTISNFIGDPAVDSNGENLILAVTVAGAAVEDNTLSFSFTNASTDVTVEGALDQVAPIPTYETGPFTVFVQPDTITVDPHDSYTSNGTAYSHEEKEMFGFKLTSVYGSGILDNINLHYLGTGNRAADVANITLYNDDDNDGVFDNPGDTPVNGDGSMGWDNVDAYTLNNTAATVISTTGNRFLAVVKLSDTAINGDNLKFGFTDGISPGDVIVGGTDSVNTFTPLDGNDFTIQVDTVAVTQDVMTPQTLYKNNSYAVLGFSLTSTRGNASLSNINIQHTGSVANQAQDIQSVSLYEDHQTLGTIGEYDSGIDTSYATMDWDNTNSYYTITNIVVDPIIDSGSGKDLIAVVGVSATPVDNDLVRFEISNTDISLVGTDSVSSTFTFNGGNFNIELDKVTVTQITVTQQPLSKNNSFAILGFNLISNLGQASLANVNIHHTGSVANRLLDIQSVGLYEDHQTLGTVGEYDSGIDTPYADMGWGGSDNYTITNISVDPAIDNVSGKKLLAVVGVGVNAVDGSLLRFEFTDANTDVTVNTPETINTISPLFDGGDFTISGDTVTVAGNMNSSATVNKGSSNKAMFGFSLTSSPGNSELDDIHLYYDGVNRTTNIAGGGANVTLYNDEGNGIYDTTETSIGNLIWAGSYYTLANAPLNYTVDTSGNNRFIVVVDVDANANDSELIRFKFNDQNDLILGSSDSVVAFTNLVGPDYTTQFDTVFETQYALGNPTTDVDKNVPTAMLGFTLATTSGNANLDDVHVHLTGNTSDIANVTLYDDEGNGIYNGTETSIRNMTWDGVGGYYTLVNHPVNYTVNTTNANFLVVVEADTNAGDNNTVQLSFTDNVNDISVTGGLDNVNISTFTESPYTINPDVVTVTQHNTPAATVPQTETSAMFGFSLATTTGNASLSNMNLYLEASSSADQSDVASIALWKDVNGDGRYDNPGDNWIENMGWDTASGSFTLNNGSVDYEITTAAIDFIVVVTVAGTAVDDETMTFEFRNNSDISLVVGDDSVDATFTGFVGAEYTVGQPQTGGPPLPPCDPDGSSEACDPATIVDITPPLPPCGPDGSAAACDPATNAPPLPPCGPDGSADGCDPTGGPPLPPCSPDGSAEACGL